MLPLDDRTIATILRHDSKVTSYKIALLRAVNDMVLSFPDVLSEEHDVAVPLRMLADFWVAYYWPFVDSQNPIAQGQQAERDGARRNDMSFRPALTELRQEWEAVLQTASLPSDGFFLISEFKAPRRRTSYPLSLQHAYNTAISRISHALLQPIRYAGPSQWSVFEEPRRARDLPPGVVPLPGTQADHVCVVIKSGLWRSFRALSLWIEALSIHEWCLFSERVGDETGQRADRGQIYFLLTARPDNRRPLTWERNHVELLMMEGVTFVCPWTRKTLATADDFDIDHLLPLAVYPVNELWNLLPADKTFNQHVKRDRIPSWARLTSAEPLIAEAYGKYEKSDALKQAVREDASVRFANLPLDGAANGFALALAKHAVRFIEEVANARSVQRF